MVIYIFRVLTQKYTTTPGYVSVMFAFQNITCLKMLNGLVVKQMECCLFVCFLWSFSFKPSCSIIALKFASFFVEQIIVRKNNKKKYAGWKNLWHLVVGQPNFIFVKKKTKKKTYFNKFEFFMEGYSHIPLCREWRVLYIML